jgi:hypothetical protein
LASSSYAAALRHLGRTYLAAKRALSELSPFELALAERG